MYLKTRWNLIVNVLAGSAFCPNNIRNRLYKLGGLNINTKKMRPHSFFFSNKVKIGEGSFINKGVYFYSDAEIEIGKNVCVAPEVMFCTADHVISHSEKRCGELVSDKITVGDGVWIGARAMILAGVTIGKGSVIGAGAIVTKDCEPNSLYLGVPAKKVKNLEEKPQQTAI